MLDSGKIVKLCKFTVGNAEGCDECPLNENTGEACVPNLKKHHSLTFLLSNNISNEDKKQIIRTRNQIRKPDLS